MGVDLMLRGVRVRLDRVRGERLVVHQIASDASQSRHLRLQTGSEAVPCGLPPANAAGIVGRLGALLGDGESGTLQDGEDLGRGRGDEDGGMSQPHGCVAFEADLIAIAGHDGLTGNLGQDVAALVFGAEGADKGVQQSIDSFQPLLVTVCLDENQRAARASRLDMELLT